MPTELPRIDYTQQVTSDTAKQDKIELTLGNWALLGSQEDIEAVREHMSVPGEHLRSDPSVNWDAYAKLFNRPDADGRRAMEFRAGALALGPEGQQVSYPPPLWAGFWKFGPHQGDAGCVTSLDVSINPTRFARSQRYRAIPSRPGQYGVVPSDALNEPRWPQTGEFALDGSTNWIPRGHVMAATHGPLWRSNLERCFRGLIDCFDGELERVCSVPNWMIQIARAPRFNLQYCETYWEFAADDAPFEVERIAPILEAYSELQSSTRSFPLVDSERVRQGHSRSITIQCGQGREVRVYAKTNQRVRFEVKHRMTGHNGFIITSPVTGRRTGHTARSWEAFAPMVERLGMDAAQTLNSLFAFIQQRLAMHPSSTTPFRLMLRFAQLIQDDAQASILLNLLVMDGQVSRRVLPPSFHPALETLRQAGILQPLANGRGARPRPYEPTPQYCAAVEWLRQSAEVVFPAGPVRSQQRASRVRYRPESPP